MQQTYQLDSGQRAAIKGWTQDLHRRFGLTGARLERWEVGKMAELTIARMLNVSPDLRAEIDPGFDLLWNGLTVDVKATTHPAGNLLVSARVQAGTSDIFQACRVDIETGQVIILGWQYADHVLEQATYVPRRSSSGGDMSYYKFPRNELITGVPTWSEHVQNYFEGVAV